MSHISANPVTAHSARITETAPVRPVLVVETLDHTDGSTMVFSYGLETASTGTTQFTFCAQATPTDTTQFTFCAQATPTDTTQFTFCAQATPTDTTQFTFCAQATPTDTFGADTAALVVVEGDSIVRSWI